MPLTVRSRDQRTPVRLVWVGDPRSGLGQLGHPLGSGVPLDCSQESLVKGRKEFFDCRHVACSRTYERPVVTSVAKW